MSLNDWVKNGWLTAHQTSVEEIRNLLAVCDRDIRDCRAEGLSPDWQMNIAYNAALQAATAALAACGYRAGRDVHHYRVIQSLALTIGAENEIVIEFDQFRKKRNIGGYEQAGLVSRKEAQEMFKLAVELRKRVQLWLQASYPELL
jgi:hypothetical protein